MRVRATTTLDQSRSALLNADLIQRLWSSEKQPHKKWTNCRGLVIAEM
jgi:hypothetical protein